MGALIVIERRTGLGDIINTGTRIDGRISAPLVENIFEPNTPLHDGAMIIREGSIVAAACFLPLAEDIAVARELGTGTGRPWGSPAFPIALPLSYPRKLA